MPAEWLGLLHSVRSSRGGRQQIDRFYQEVQQLLANLDPEAAKPTVSPAASSQLPKQVADVAAAAQLQKQVADVVGVDLSLQKCSALAELATSPTFRGKGCASTALQSDQPAAQQIQSASPQLQPVLPDVSARPTASNEQAQRMSAGEHQTATALEQALIENHCSPPPEQADSAETGTLHQHAGPAMLSSLCQPQVNPSQRAGAGKHAADQKSKARQQSSRHLSMRARLAQARDISPKHAQHAAAHKLHSNSRQRRELPEASVAASSGPVPEVSKPGSAVLTDHSPAGATAVADGLQPEAFEAAAACIALSAAATPSHTAVLPAERHQDSRAAVSDSQAQYRQAAATAADNIDPAAATAVDTPCAAAAVAPVLLQPAGQILGPVGLRNGTAEPAMAVQTLPKHAKHGTGAVSGTGATAGQQLQDRWAASSMPPPPARTFQAAAKVRPSVLTD